jgi:hypothetical protein
MGCLGVHFAITEDQVDRLMAALGGPDGDDRVLAIALEEIEETWDRAWLQETDKAWDAIHRCLTDGELDWHGGEYPLDRCILGGTRLYDRDDHILVLIYKDEVPDVAEDLAPIDEADLRRRYQRISAASYPWKSDDDFDYVWHWFQLLKGFWQRAAAAGRSVLFSATQ